jgi:nitrile hydratase
MNGVHDLGGVDGFGAVEVEAAEPVFHAEWERRVFGMTAVASAALVRNIHRFRHAVERMEPRHYLRSPYYEHWLTALATLLVESGAITLAELQARAACGFPLSRSAATRRGADGCTERSPAPLCAGRPRARAQRPPARAHALSPLRARPAR